MAYRRVSRCLDPLIPRSPVLCANGWRIPEIQQFNKLVISSLRSVHLRPFIKRVGDM